MSATPVAPLSRSAAKTCPKCHGKATWQVSWETVSCTDDVGRVLEDLYRADPDPFIPPVPKPLRRIR